MKLKIRHLVVSSVVLIGGLVGVGAGVAEAAYGDCPSGYNCFFSGPSGTGSKWQFAGNNTNISGYGISSQSGYNRGTSGMRACGYRYTGYVDMNYSRPQYDTETYSARPIKSNQWVWGTCPG